MRTFTPEFCDELADYLEEQNESLAEVNRIPPAGPIDDPEIAAEVARVRTWIERLRASDTS